jgi:putative DNA primase/helicase
MNAVKHALGDYADTAPAGLLLVNRNESYTQANPVLARLPGKRLVDVSEPPAGAELNGAMVKKLASGQDEISCRQLHREEFTYVPDFTVWMHCNALPVVRDASAIDPRHMFVIEFTRSFGPDERDPRLWEELTSEEGATDVMEWLLVGYQEWRERGLDAPRSVTDATVAWLRTSGTWLDRFLEEECVLGSDRRCPIPLMKAAMTAWTEENDVDMLSMYKVNKYLEQRTVTRGKSGDVRYYAGIDLLPTTLTKYALVDGDSCPTKKGGGGRVKLR